MLIIFLKEKFSFIPKFFWVKVLPFSIGKSPDANLFINQSDLPDQKIQIDLQQGKLIQIEDQVQSLLKPIKIWSFSSGKLLCLSLRNKNDLHYIFQIIQNALLKIPLPFFIIRHKTLLAPLLGLIFLGFAGMTVSYFSNAQNKKPMIIKIPTAQYVSLPINENKMIGLSLSHPSNSKKLLRFYISHMNGIEKMALGKTTLPLFPHWQGPRYVVVSKDSRKKILWMQFKGISQRENYIQLGNLEFVELPSSINCSEKQISSLPIWNQIDHLMQCDALFPKETHRTQIQNLNNQLIKKRESLQFHFLQAVQMNLHLQAKEQLQALLHLLPDPKDPFHQKIKRKMNELLQIMQLQGN